MGALELYKINASKARYQVQREPWFHAAEVAVVRNMIIGLEQFREAPKHVLDHYSNQIVHDPRSASDKQMRKLAEDYVHTVLLSFRKAGIVPVPLDS